MPEPKIVEYKILRDDFNNIVDEYNEITKDIDQKSHVYGFEDMVEIEFSIVNLEMLLPRLDEIQTRTTAYLRINKIQENTKKDYEKALLEVEKIQSDIKTLLVGMKQLLKQ